MKYDINIDSFIGYPISKGYIASKLKNFKNKPVTVRINSYGGDVQHALDIRQQFIDHGDVTVYIYGMTASSATILAMGAKKIYMSKYATMMIHNCSGWVDAWGHMNSEQISEAIRQLSAVKDQVDKIDEIIANIYAGRSKKDLKEMAGVMAKQEWLNAEECKALGLIDVISEEGDEIVITDEVKDTLVACGLPLPEVHKNKVTATAQPQEPGSLDTVCRTFMNNVARFFGMESRLRDSGDKPDLKDNNTEVKPKNYVSMKNYTALAAALGIEAIGAKEDGSAVFTAESLQKVNDRIAALEDKVKKQEDQIRQKDQQIADLGKKDGDTTGQVHQDGEKKESFEDIYKSVQKYVH